MKISIQNIFFIINLFCVNTLLIGMELSPKISAEEFLTDYGLLCTGLMSFNPQLIDKALNNQCIVRCINEKFMVPEDINESMLELNNSDAQEAKFLTLPPMHILDIYFYIVKNHLLFGTLYKNREDTLYNNAIPILKSLLSSGANPNANLDFACPEASTPLMII